MKSYLFIISFSLITAFTLSAKSIEIQANKLLIDYGQNKILYSGNVIASNTNMKLYCDTINITYLDIKQSTRAKNELVNIDTAFNFKNLKTMELTKVKIVGPNQIATGDKGILEPTSQRIILEGNVALQHDNRYAQGSKLIYDIKKDTFKLVGDKKSKNRVSVLLDR